MVIRMSVQKKKFLSYWNICSIFFLECEIVLGISRFKLPLSLKIIVY